ncbi:hypothetical protein [Nitrosopumilus sp.]|uniref:hypothetical protein n=1 Tax=Nitrosopumilus sp. TaxID=2024843 RepID=UPI00260D9472|nr:hypothetical protein [Nitrosopumilus sp.]
MNKLNMIAMILKQRKYAMIALLASTGFGLVHYFLSMSMLQTHFDVIAESIPLYLATSLSLSAVVAILAGVNISLLVYKIKGVRGINLKKSGGSTVAGSAFAVFTPGCPACTTPLIVILGAVGGLAVFPLQGLELKIISVVALLFSIYWVSRGLQQPSCCNMKEKIQ